MFKFYKKHIGCFFLALWAINHVLYLGHSVFAHHLFECSHHNHAVHKLNKSTDYIASFEECIVCDSDWLNIIDPSEHFLINTRHQDEVQVTQGYLNRLLSYGWILKSLTKRGPPAKG